MQLKIIEDKYGNAVWLFGDEASPRNGFEGALYYFSYSTYVRSSHSAETEFQIHQLNYNQHISKSPDSLNWLLEQLAGKRGILSGLRGKQIWSSSIVNVSPHELAKVIASEFASCYCPQRPTELAYKWGGFIQGEFPIFPPMNLKDVH